MRDEDKIESETLLGAGCVFGCLGFAIAIAGAITGVMLWAVVHIVVNKF
jgi:hypothetical protein